jgi:4-hydroxyphenylpyruvate dioxygenase
MKSSIASLSLGRTWVHSLDKKLDQAAVNNFDGIELFYEDLEYIAKSLPGGPTPANHLLAAQQIRSMCDARCLPVICLQPFMHYEGLIDRTRHTERIEEFKLWLRLCKILGTDLIVIPSNFLDSGITGDWKVLISDMREVADLAAEEGVRIAYEALCWGVFVDTWERSYELVRAVDRSNFGICLDTFGICGRVFADPAEENGCMPGADEAMRKSLEKMKETVDVNKVFFVQAADAERMREPLTEEHIFHVKEQPSRMSWSRNARLFPGESSKGAYLPVLDVLRAITGDDGLGYTGWVSFEIFSRSLTGARPGVVEDHAKRAGQSWKWLVKELGWRQETENGLSKGSGNNFE